MADVMQMCIRTLQVVAASQASTLQVVQRPPTFAGKLEEATNSFVNQLKTYLMDRRVPKEDWLHIFNKQLREAAAV